ncbi:MAG: cob(I)yrinic acid a,c-diamide adenosyltransferase [Hyphomicrobiales bacterium]|nr:cob(I)yrinic acid a,c-diamide adenosyltransferase [Hyphomicrobiales bacterium]
MVKINKVATRVGDDGRTALGDGARLPKFHVRVAALGSIDEANAFIGLAAHFAASGTRAALEHVQNDLFDIGADLCNPQRNVTKAALRLTETQVEAIDDLISTHNAGLPALDSFVTPSGSLASLYLHAARAVVRRAEREIVEVAFQDPLTPAIIRYLNRLSDLLFVLARVENRNGAPERLWEPGRNARARDAGEP